MNRIVITGGEGFLGWHLACRLRALTDADVHRVGRMEMSDPDAFARTVASADVVYHLAGVNRTGSDEEVEHGNLRLAEDLVKALGERTTHVVYANTIHQGGDTPYGRGKEGAARILASHGSTLADIRLPNLFGEHGRPHYNSFVATFCHEIVHGRQPAVSNDRLIPLLHAQAAAAALMQGAERRESHVIEPLGEEHHISDVLAMLENLHGTYAERGEIPDLSTPFATDMFNTYRSHLFPQHAPIYPDGHADDRGVLHEAVRSHGGQGQAYVSTTVPGAMRGEHYHLRKVERFLVVKGDAEISLRRLLDHEIVTFPVSGDRPAIVDMPTMWVHNIRNVGTTELVTMFWSNQLLDPRDPDQYPERVQEAEAALR